MATVEDTLKYIATNEIRWIDLQFFDVTGNLNRTTIASRKLSELSFGSGIYTTDLKKVFGESNGELLLRPDSDTLARIPWEQSSVRLICDVIQEKEGYPKDPRMVAQKTETAVKAAGLKMAKIGTEAEFCIFDSTTQDRTAPGRGTGILIESREAEWSPTTMHATRGAYVGQPYDTVYAARTQMADMLEDSFGVLVDGHWHGKNITGQQVMQIKERNMVGAGDALNTLKFVARNLTAAVNASATFMPLPVSGEKGNSLNIAMSLWKTSDSNYFYEGTDEYCQLSQSGRYFIGGLLEHANALSLFTAPTSNSYKRLMAEETVVGWSAHQTNALVQVPCGKKNMKEVKRVVYVADPSVNPYLAFGVIMAAGLDGLKNKIDPGDPLDQAGKKKRNYKDLPRNLYEAAEALESDTKFLTTIMPKEILGDYLDLKLGEFKESQKSPNQYEFRKYYNV